MTTATRQVTHLQTDDDVTCQSFCPPSPACDLTGVFLDNGQPRRVNVSLFIISTAAATLKILIHSSISILPDNCGGLQSAKNIAARLVTGTGKFAYFYSCSASSPPLASPSENRRIVSIMTFIIPVMLRAPTFRCILFPHCVTGVCRWCSALDRNSL
jgi:hypothetical protein